MEEPNPTAWLDAILQHLCPRLGAAPAPGSFLIWGWGGKGGGKSGLYIGRVVTWIVQGMVVFHSLKWGMEDPGDVSWMLDVRSGVLHSVSPTSSFTI